ncbi:MAG TPA: hypothetical protein VLM90_15975 [Candidatus Deferrimicrobium sp.]|nr:hypothetical protein [Candidatus Deferrimicrobium sp.]
MILKVTLAGDEGNLERRGYVFLANHVGYIDGIVLGSIFPSTSYPTRKSAVGPSSAR